jgi:hypothetical protein
MTEGVRRATEVIPENGSGAGQPDAGNAVERNRMKGERNRSMNENAAVIDVTGLMENPQVFKKLLIDQIRAR